MEESLRVNANIHSAVRSGDVRKVISALNDASNYDISSIVGFGQRALLQAVDSQRHDIAKILLGAEVDPNFCLENESPLSVATVRRDNEEMVRLLLEFGGDPTFRGHESHEPPILKAICMNDSNIVRLMVDAVVCVDDIRVRGDTLLWYAISYSNVDIARILIDAGASLRESLKYLECAMIIGTDEMLELLIRSGINVGAADCFGRTALRYAVKRKIPECVSMLLKAGADPNCTFLDGTSVLIDAVVEDCTKSVSMLIDAGANVDHPGYHGKTALNYASGGSFEMTALLLREGADPNIPDVRGDTPFYVALRYPVPHKTHKILFESGANPFCALPIPQSWEERGRVGYLTVLCLRVIKLKRNGVVVPPWVPRILLRFPWEQKIFERGEKTKKRLREGGGKIENKKQK